MSSDECNSHESMEERRCSQTMSSNDCTSSESTGYNASYGSDGTVSDDLPRPCVRAVRASDPFLRSTPRYLYVPLCFISICFSLSKSQTDSLRFVPKDVVMFLVLKLLLFCCCVLLITDHRWKS